MRSVLAVLAGYILFAGSAVALFAVTGSDPNVAARSSFTAAAIAYGALFGVASGWTTAAIARRRPYLHATILGGIMAIGATISLLALPSGGAPWTQISTIVLFAPLTLLGARLRAGTQSRSR